MDNFKIVKVTNQKDGSFICNCKIAETLAQRTKGLLGRTSLKEDEGMLITNCHSIHCFFMKFDICAIFLNRKNKVIKIIDNFKKNRMSRYYIMSQNVLELPAFSATRNNIKKGDILNFIEEKGE